MEPLILFAIAFVTPIHQNSAFTKTVLCSDHLKEYSTTYYHHSVDQLLISRSRPADGNNDPSPPPNGEPRSTKKPQTSKPKCTGGDDVKDCNKN